jgi:hypothetical protein
VESSYGLAHELDSRWQVPAVTIEEGKRCRSGTTSTYRERKEGGEAEVVGACDRNTAVRLTMQWGGRASYGAVRTLGFLYPRAR